MTHPHPSVAFIGFGEAGQAIAEGLREEGVSEIAAWDILFALEAGMKLRGAAQRIGVRAADCAAEAVADAQIIIAAVTAASSHDAAQSAAPHLQGRPLYLDINSVSPGRKRESASLLEGKAHYIDVAIVSAILPKRHKSPMLVAGPHAGEALAQLAALGMSVAFAGETVGAAAAIKMVRSVMIKGIEALTLECFLAAARAGVTEPVAQSLNNNYPQLDWAKVAEYNLERMASHGLRRAAEMEQVAATLRELGIDPLMTEATARRQREMGEAGTEQAVRTSLAQGRAAMLDAIGTALKKLR